MRKWVLVLLAVAVLAAPAMSRASVPLATGGGSVTMREVDEPTSVYKVRYYTLVGTFTVGKKIYTGTVTGQWSQDLYSRGGEFSGNNGKHSFTASNCDFRTGLPDETRAETTPSGRSELYTCSANIDGTDHAQIALYFEYLQMYPSGEPCCLWAWKGVFVGV
jgi:hypothetical protein